MASTLEAMASILCMACKMRCKAELVLLARLDWLALLALGGERYLVQKLEVPHLRVWHLLRQGTALCRRGLSAKPELWDLVFKTLVNMCKPVGTAFNRPLFHQGQRCFNKTTSLTSKALH